LLNLRNTTPILATISSLSLLLASLSIYSRQAVAESYDPPMDSSSLSSITAHDAGSKYFLSMYTSTRTRIFACFVGSTAGCFLVGLREARVREGLKAPLKAAFDVLSVIFSYLFLTKCVFGDLKVQEEEWTENGYTKVRFLVWTRVNYSLLCGCLLLSLGGSSVMSPNSSSPPPAGALCSFLKWSLKLLSIPSILLSPSPYSPFPGTSTHLVSYGR